MPRVKKGDDERLCERFVILVTKKRMAAYKAMCKDLGTTPSQRLRESMNAGFDAANAAKQV